METYLKTELRRYTLTRVRNAVQNRFYILEAELDRGKEWQKKNINSAHYYISWNVTVSDLRNRM